MDLNVTHETNRIGTKTLDPSSFCILRDILLLHELKATDIEESLNGCDGYLWYTSYLPQRLLPVNVIYNSFLSIETKVPGGDGS